MSFIQAVSGHFERDIDVVEVIVREIPKLCRPLRIGRLYLRHHQPASRMTPLGQLHESDIYLDENGYDEEQLIESMFPTGEEGMFTVKMYPVKGVHWTEPDIGQIRFLSGSLFSIISRVRMQSLLFNAMFRDMMTGALNTPGLMRHGGMLHAKGQLSRYVGIFLNVKNFKYINQSVGGRRGDDILLYYYRDLMAHIQGEEEIARPGGDNFFALIRKENADDFLSHLTEVPVHLPTENGELTFLLSAHAGIYDIGPEDDMGKTLNLATIALNIVKHSDQATDQLWYHPSMQERLMREKQVSQLFPRALRDQEFLVFYQPKVNLATGMLCGCEALVRWARDGKIVPPMEFVPVLEKEGTVCSLDFYVFDRVCSDLRNWLDKGVKPVRVSVNFSQQHLRSLDLAERIEAIMEYYQISSDLIEIELTELSGVKNHDAMMAFLKKMHSKGISTSIDDFGTGYSTLNMLREFDMDIIKLDKSFLDRIARNDVESHQDEIVIENIVRMAQSLNLQIISEGVERVEQADFLKEIHCDMAQGYLFDKPLPHDTFENRLLGPRYYCIHENT